MTLGTARPKSIEVLARLREALQQRGWSILRPPKASQAPYHFRATRRQRTFVVRVQASTMAFAEIQHAQRAFLSNGSSCLWIFSQPTFPVDAQLPALWLDPTPESDLRFPSGVPLEARSPGVASHWSQKVTALELAEGISAKALWYGTARAGDQLHVAIDGTLCRCGRCGHVGWYPCMLQLTRKGSVIMSLPPARLPRRALDLLLRDRPYRIGRAAGSDSFVCLSCSKAGISLGTVPTADSKPLFDSILSVTGWDARTLRQLPASHWHI